MAVIAGACNDLPAAQMIGAAVAHVRPVGAPALHQAQCDRGAWPVIERKARAVLDDLLMRGAQAHVQEAERIEQWVRRRAEALREDLHRDLRGPLTFGVTAHAVPGDQQRGLTADFGLDPVLIAVPRAS